MLNKKNLLSRTVVGIGIFALLLAMILMDVYLPAGFFEVSFFRFLSGRSINSLLISVIILLAVVEMRRALGKERIPDCFSWLLWAYGFGVGTFYSLFGYTGIIFITMLVFFGAAVTSLLANRADSLIYVAYMLVYPGLFLACLLYLNRSAATHEHLAMAQFFERDVWSILAPDSNRATNLLPLNAIGLAFVFAVSSFTDVFAYFVGSLLGRHKLCPDISPNKTIEGAIGGVVGGAFGSFIVFVVFDWVKLFPPQYGLTYSGLGLSTWVIVVIYCTIGLFGSVFTQVGDLLASHVKRYCGIKDYSHILGAHGGIMDRFDGIMLNAVFVAIMFMFIL